MGVTLIVLAHPEPASFNGAWARATAEAVRAMGDEVLWSDLYAMGFDAAERRAHYPGYPEETPFDPLKAQERAAEASALPPDVASEIAKIRTADRIVFHFPLWWFAPPAILKGWTERVLAHGALHDVARRFDTGLCRGKRALMCVTTGADSAESGLGGKEGDTRLHVWPFAYTLRYLGFTVVEPVLLHGVHGYHTGARRDALEVRLGEALAAQAGVMKGFAARATIAFNPDSDFGADGRLRQDAPSHSPFIRHDGD